MIQSRRALTDTSSDSLIRPEHVCTTRLANGLHVRGRAHAGSPPIFWMSVRAAYV